MNNNNISTKSKDIKKPDKKAHKKHKSEQKEEEKTSKMVPKTILVVGAPGVGKSNFCNFMIDGRASARFETSSEVKEGVTQTLQIEENHALDILQNQRI
jgi:predicted GTPase